MKGGSDSHTLFLSSSQVEVKLVNSRKILGLAIANDLTWNYHGTDVIKKASKRLYFLTQLKTVGVPPYDLTLFYVSCVRSVIDYALPVFVFVFFFNSLPQYLRSELARFGKRAISIITSEKRTSSQELGVKPILEHHASLCSKLYDSSLSGPNHKLKAFLGPVHDNSRYNLRRQCTQIEQAVPLYSL